MKIQMVKLKYAIKECREIEGILMALLLQVAETTRNVVFLFHMKLNNNTVLKKLLLKAV